MAVSTRDIPLRHLVLAILSLASQGGRARVPISKFYTGFAALVDISPKEFPPIHFVRTPHSCYSKRLDDALQGLVGYSLELPNPSLQDIEVPVDVAARHLARLQHRYGADFIKRIRPLAESFSEGLVKAS